ncbi:MAG: allophanate hydrolase subunit 1 [Nitratireductor sp.]
MQGVTFYAVADHAILVQLGTDVSEALSERVQKLDRAIAANPPLGLLETVPAFVNLLAKFDPLVTDHGEMESEVRALLSANVQDQKQASTHEVPVCYDRDFAPDLEAVAKATDMSEEAVISMHLSGAYSVGMYGFAPGYAYLSGVPSPMQVPRKATAIRDIPAGRVLIAGPQCLVTTLKMPTGWSIIGSSPTQVLQNDPDNPFLFDVGDRVQFRRVDRASYEELIKGRT